MNLQIRHKGLSHPVIDHFSGYWGNCEFTFSNRNVGGGVAGGEGVVVGEDDDFGAVVAEGGLVVAADDGEGVEDVGGVGASCLGWKSQV